MKKTEALYQLKVKKYNDQYDVFEIKIDYDSDIANFLYLQYIAGQMLLTIGSGV